MELLHTILWFIIILSPIVFIHEFGHYIVAKWCGVKVEEFSIGFGKELFGFTDKSGTRWKFSILPLGGFVKMYGDISEASYSSEEAMEKMSDEEKKLTFYHKPLYKKAAIVVAGPIANFLMTITIFTYFIFNNGLSTSEPIVGDVLPDTPAYEAGIKSGDVIEAIDGEKIKRFRDITNKILVNVGTPVTLTVNRDGDIMEIVLTPKIIEEEDSLGNKVKRPIIGIVSQKIKVKDVGIVHALVAATQQTYDITMMSIEYIGQIVTGNRSAKELKGPVGIADMSGKAAEKGLETVLYFMAMLSASLGLINLFPIPPLDGGHLMFYALEGARGRPVAEKFQEYSFRAGFALLLMLMAFTIYNDVKNMFT